MKISLNEIKKLVKIPDGITDEELIERIGSRLVEIEEVVDLSPRYKGVYIAKVVGCEPIEGTHLHLCQIDVGVKTAEFSEAETVQVVCGAPNVHTGMLAVWIAPGAIVPETYGNENFKLSVRKLRGYESHGMLAGADELALANEHKLIAEIDSRLASPGDSFAEIFGLNDTILDVENKSLTHRPDCFGLIGFAREVAGILGVRFQEPEWIKSGLGLGDGDRNSTGVLQTLSHDTDSQAGAGSIRAQRDEKSATVSGDNGLQERLSVAISDSNLCPRYSCAVFELGDNKPSKFLTENAVFLAKAGMRAIDPMVDLTNIIMLMTGQPLHAFDYDKLIAVGGTKSPKIIVRVAKEGEELQLLDGETIKCIPEDILITSNDVPVALAGAMGGKNTEIDASTKRVVLESATFSLYNLRKTQMAHGIFSEAITRFTKGQPAAMTLPVLLEAVRELGVEPLALADVWQGDKEPSVVKITTLAVNRLLGSDYSTAEIADTLQDVGFEIKDYQKAVKKIKKVGPLKMSLEIEKVPNKELIVTAPRWRTDIHIPEDVIEEVGRLLGFDNIPLDLPQKSFSGSEVAPMWKLKQELRSTLSDRLGMHELLTYSFVSKDLLEKVGQDPENSYEIVNSISPELQRFRQQIVPSLLSKVRENIKAGYDNFSLYELNQVSTKAGGLTDEQTPVLENHLGVVQLGDFYKLKADILVMLSRGLKVKFEYASMLGNSEAAQKYPYLEPARSAVLSTGSEIIGAFGEVKSAVLRCLKIEKAAAAAEISLDGLVDLKPELKKDLQLSKFPFVERDLTLKVASDAAFGRFDEKIRGVLNGEELINTVSAVSIYQAKVDDSTKNISFHLRFSSRNKTLDQAEISDIMERITMEVAKIGAEVI